MTKQLRKRLIERALEAMPPAARRMVRRLHEDDDGAALVLTVLTIVIISGLAMVLLAVLLNQALPAYAAQKRTQSVYAAEAGLQAGLSELRSYTKTVSGSVYGSLDKLRSKCVEKTSTEAAHTEISGWVDGDSSATSGTKYTVKTTYYVDDPTGHTEDWLTDNAMTCSTMSAVQPTYALITSTGSEVQTDGTTSTGSRSMSGIYAFSITNVNKSTGGRIWVMTSKNACLKAVSTTKGSKIVFASASECEKTDAASNALMNWVYDSTWHIRLGSTGTDAGNTELCIANPKVEKTTGGWGWGGWGGTTTWELNGDAKAAVLEECADDSTLSDADFYEADKNHRWEWIGGAYWQGKVSGTYLGRKDNELWIASSGTSFDPDPSLGAGAASKSTNQLVNYKEFGRCADVTYADINQSYMIVYPCKQDATGGSGFLWNHKWYYTEPAVYYDPHVDSRDGRTDDGGPNASEYTCTDSNQNACVAANQQITMRVYDDSSKTYCLTVASTTSKSSELVFRSCNGSASQKFTRYTGVSDSSKAWTIRDAYGRCVTADESIKLDSSWSHMTVDTCNSGDLSQKWNAPALSSSSSFGGFREVGD